MNVDEEIDDQITFFGCTECYNGKTDSSYEVNMNTSNCKTLLDMTIEAAMSKASILLGILSHVHKCTSWDSVIDDEATITSIEADIYHWCLNEFQNSTDVLINKLANKALSKLSDEVYSNEQRERQRELKRQVILIASGIYDESRFSELVSFKKLTNAFDKKENFTISARKWMQFMMKGNTRGEITDTDCDLSSESFLHGQFRFK